MYGLEEVSNLLNKAIVDCDSGLGVLALKLGDGRWGGGPGQGWS